MAVSFSIIIPVYNKSRYIRDCIDSVLAQSHQDYEIIVINDGSTDNSLDILNSFEDDRLKIVTVCNGGVSKARNIGIELATKEYITFVDGDDRLGKNYLETYSKNLESKSIDIAIGGLTKIHRNGTHQIVRSSLPIGVISKKEFIDNYVSQLFLNEGILGYVAAKFIRRSILTSNDLRFDTTLRLAEDLDFWAKVYLKVNTIKICDSNAYFYLQETENSTYNLLGQYISQLNIWLFILNNYTSGAENQRQAVLLKINGLIEAHFLELSELTLKNVKTDIGIMNVYVGPYSEELKRNTGSFLQSQIARSDAYAVWLYLKFRTAYHSLRK